MLVDKDFEKLQKYSNQNIQELKEILGAHACEQIERLKQKYLEGKKITFFHKIGGNEENIKSVIKSGCLKSYTQIEKELGRVDGAHTITKDGVSGMFGSVNLRADPYQDSVYFRLFTDLKEKKGSGVYIEKNNIPQEAWMNFRDPGHISHSDMHDSYWSSSVSRGGFQYHDVFVGEDIKGAIILKALKNFSYIADVYKNQGRNRKSFSEILNKVEDCVCADSRQEFFANRNTTAEELSRGWFVNAEKFDEYFCRVIDFTLKDLSEVGQITLPQKVNVENATLVYKQQSKTIKAWQAELANNPELLFSLS